MTKRYAKVVQWTGLSTAAAVLLLSSMGAPTALAAGSDASAQTLTMPTPPSTQALSIVLMDADNGQILYEKDANERRAPASTTKLMTMLLVMKALKEHKVSWDEEVPVTPDAYKIATMPDVSDAYLDPKEHFTLQEMMKFIAVLSANDATVAVADLVGGDQQSFVAQMNQEAKTLGLTNTHYMNSDGLPENNHYTSARDLATLGRYLVENYPELLQYTSMKQVTVRSGNTWPNTDELLGNYPGVDGLKTGYTSDAGYCYVGTAEQNGVRIISVVMGDTKTNIHQRFLDTAKLFDYGFHDFTESKPLQSGETLPQTVTVKSGKATSIPIKAANSLIVDLPNGTKGTVKVVTTPVFAPVKQGDKVGTAEYVVGNQVVGSTDLVAATDDPQANWFVRLLRGIGHWFTSLLHKL